MSTSRGFSSFTDAILFQARLDPHSVAVCLNSREIGYGAFWSDICKVTGHLQRHRLPRGTRVAVHVQQVYLRWLAILALARLGLVSASLSDAPQELELVAPQAIISDSAASAPGVAVIQAAEHWLEGEHDPALDGRDADGSPDEPCRLVVSSGTTGTPKKALLTRRDVHERLRANARAYALHPGVRLATTMSPQAIGGFTMPLSCWAAGGAVVMAAVPASHAMLHLLRLRPQVLFVSVVQLSELMQTLPPDYQASYQPRIYVAGSAIPPALGRSVRLRVTQSLFVVYGSTEAGTVTIAHAARADERPGFTGHVVPSAQVQIVDQQHRPVAAGQPGEVRIRAEGMIRRYDGGEAESNFRAGWFYPGDAGVLDATGGLAIIGRTREVMNFGGVKLAPEAVEHALQDCRGLVEFAAFSLAAEGRQLPWVAVVAGEDFSNDGMAARFAAAFPGLPALSIVRLERLPRNAMGKVLRSELAAMVGTALARNGSPPAQAARPASSA